MCIGNDDVKITLHFTNPNVIINAKAFSMLHTSVDKIYLKKDKTSVKIENVHVDAFDSTIDHQVSVFTNNYMTWDEKFRAVTSFGKVKFVDD